MLKVYLAGPMRMMRFIDETVKPMVERAGCRVMSSWHAPPYRDRDDFISMSRAAIEQAFEQNDTDIGNSDAGLVFLEHDAGETLAELRLMTILEMPVLVVGTRRILSCNRPKVILADSLAEAVATLDAVSLRNGREMGRAAE